MVLIWHWLEGVSTWHAFDPYIDLAQKLGHVVDHKAIKARLRTLHDDVLLDTQPRAGAVRLLDEAKTHGLKLGVASSSSHAWVDHHLARYNLLEYFDAIKCRDDVGNKRTKPKPDLYLAVLDVLGVSSNEVIAFEDSLNGVKAAKAAGINVIAVSNPVTQHMQLGIADRVIESFEAVRLAELLRTYF